MIKRWAGKSKRRYQSSARWSEGLVCLVKRRNKCWRRLIKQEEIQTKPDGQSIPFRRGLSDNNHAASNWNTSEICGSVCAGWACVVGLSACCQLSTRYNCCESKRRSWGRQNQSPKKSHTNWRFHSSYFLLFGWVGLGWRLTWLGSFLSYLLTCFFSLSSFSATASHCFFYVFYVIERKIQVNEQLLVAWQRHWEKLATIDERLSDGSTRPPAIVSWLTYLDSRHRHRHTTDRPTDQPPITYVSLPFSLSHCSFHRTSFDWRECLFTDRANRARKACVCCKRWVRERVILKHPNREKVSFFRSS